MVELDGHDGDYRVLAMPISPGTHTFGPSTGTLAVRTGRAGAVAKAGHDLLLHVTEWQGTLEVADDSTPATLALEADGASLRVREGTGGMQALDDDDRANIQQTIDEEVLKRTRIEYRSSSIRPLDDGRVAVDGELVLAGSKQALAVELRLGDDEVSGSAVIKQSEWGIKPYSTLFGALKVADDVRVEFEGRLAR
jgi:polyisoprenoid-binding protein YceI